MTRQITTAEQAAFLEMVAIQLASHFVPQLRLLCNRKTFYTHAGILAEIFEWSLEFFDLYYDDFPDDAEPADVEEAAIAFGHFKFDGLSTVPALLDKYFIAKYKNVNPILV